MSPSWGKPKSQRSNSLLISGAEPQHRAKTQVARTYCPQRKAQQRDEERCPIPAGDAMDQQSAVICSGEETS